MKTFVFAAIAGALLAGCTVRSETTVQRPAPAAVVVPADSTTTTTTRDSTGATTSTTVYR